MRSSLWMSLVFIAISLVPKCSEQVAKSEYSNSHLHLHQLPLQLHKTGVLLLLKAARLMPSSCVQLHVLLDHRAVRSLQSAPLAPVHAKPVPPTGAALGPGPSPWVRLSERVLCKIQELSSDPSPVPMFISEPKISRTSKTRCQILFSVMLVG